MHVIYGIKRPTLMCLGILGEIKKKKKRKKEVCAFGIALIKNKWQVKLGDAGTIDRFSLAFQ